MGGVFFSGSVDPALSAQTKDPIFFVDKKMICQRQVLPPFLYIFVLPFFFFFLFESLMVFGSVYIENEELSKTLYFGFLELPCFAKKKVESQKPSRMLCGEPFFWEDQEGGINSLSPVFFFKRKCRKINIPLVHTHTHTHIDLKIRDERR